MTVAISTIIYANLYCLLVYLFGNDYVVIN